jgi:hypothetical protein
MSIFTPGIPRQYVESKGVEPIKPAVPNFYPPMPSVIDQQVPRRGNILMNNQQAQLYLDAWPYVSLAMMNQTKLPLDTVRGGYSGQDVTAKGELASANIALTEASYKYGN